MQNGIFVAYHSDKLDGIPDIFVGNMH
jgi:hypothetical protein